MEEQSPYLQGITAVLFDFDGTLVNSLADIAAAVNAALRHFDLPEIDAAKIRAFVGDGSKALIQRAALYSSRSLGMGIEIPAGIIDAIHAWYIQYYNQHPLAQTKLYPNTTRLLMQLEKHGIHMGIVTSKPGAICRKILHHFGIEHFFTVVVAQEHVSNLKPHPEGIQKAVRAISARIANVDDPNGLPVVQDEETSLRRAIAFVAAADEYSEYDEEFEDEAAQLFVPAPLTQKDIANFAQALESESADFAADAPAFPLLPPEQVLMVGDSAGDINAGAAFGCHTAAVTGGFGNAVKLMEAPAEIVVQYASDLLMQDAQALL